MLRCPKCNSEYYCILTVKIVNKTVTFIYEECCYSCGYGENNHLAESGSLTPPA